MSYINGIIGRDGEKLFLKIINTDDSVNTLLI